MSGPRSLGQAMREARRKRGAHVAELSRRTGVAKNTIWDYERDVGLSQMVNIMALADALGISVDEYIGHEVQDRKETATNDR